MKKLLRKSSDDFFANGTYWSQEDLQDAVKFAVHSHKNKPDGNSSCVICGHDIRHPIHKRTKERPW